MATSEELEFVLKAKNEASAAFRDLEQAIKKLGDTSDDASKKPPIPDDMATRIDNVKAALAGVTASVATAVASFKFFGSGLSAFSDFEREMYQVQGAANLTKEEFAKLSEELGTLTTQLPVSTNELAAIAEIGADLGIEGRENIVKFTEAMAQMGITSGVSGPQAAQAIAQLVNVTGEAIDQAPLIASIATRLGDETKATVNGLLESASMMARVTGQYGVSAKESLAFGAALAQSGVNARQGAMTIGQVFGQIGSAVSAGGDKLRYFAEVAGMSADDFKKSFEEDASGAVTHFITKLSEYSRSGRNDIFKEMGLQAGQANRVLGPLIANVDNLRKAQELANDEASKGTALAAETAEQMEAYGAKVDVMRNSIHELMVGIGAALAPIMGDVVSAITAVAQGMKHALDAMSPFFKQLVVWGGVAVTAIVAIVTAIKGFGAALAAAKMSIGAIISVPLLGWVVGITAVVVGLIAAWKALSDHFEDIGGPLNGMKVIFTQSLAAVGDVIGAFVDSVKDRVQEMVDGFMDAGRVIAAYMKGIWEGVFSSATINEAVAAAMKQAEAARVGSGFADQGSSFSDLFKQNYARRSAETQAGMDAMLTRMRIEAGTFVGPMPLVGPVQPSPEAVTSPTTAAASASGEGKDAPAGVSDAASKENFQEFVRQERIKIDMIGMRGEALVKAQAISTLDAAQLKNAAQVNQRVALAVQAHNAQVMEGIRVKDEEIAVSQQSYEAQKLYAAAIAAGVDPLKDTVMMEQLRASVLRQIKAEQDDFVKANGMEAQYVREQIGLYRLDSKERVIQSALMKAQYEAKVEGRDLTDAEAASVRDLAEANWELDESGEAYGRIEGYIGDVGSAFADMTKGLLMGTTSMEDALGNLANTLAEVAIQAAIIDPFKSWVGDTFSLGNIASFLGTGFANGGIMSANGEVPLRRYASGGVATSPQLALFGEGSHNEAYVPLPDGRSIPVTMTGGGNGGSNNNFAITVNVNMNSSSGGGQSADEASRIGKEASRAVNEAMNEWARRQARPGGALWNMGAT